MAVGSSVPHKRMPFDIDVPVVPFGAGAGALPRDFPYPSWPSPRLSTSGGGSIRPVPSSAPP
ncbi:hypothetical protein U9M48_025765 [Paspalum notatum var. saurae]|uniref:Uncharacterized protein n=1 Tax=Paspalum notatum var. saurae TaxID=547442 RepID=A0AAQ3TT99_PASNO